MGTMEKGMGSPTPTPSRLLQLQALCLLSEHFMSLWLCGHCFCKNKSVIWKVAFVVSCSGDHDMEALLAQVQAPVAL